MTTETITGPAGLTAAEQAYFDSRGTKTDGLGIEADVGDAALAADAPKPDKPAASVAEGKPDAGATAKTGTDLDPDEEPVGEDGRPRNPGRFIRFGAFDKERNRRKELKRELAAEREGRGRDRESHAQLAERLDLLNQALQPPATAKTEVAAVEPPPDPEKDIFGYVRWQDQRLADLQRHLDDTAKQGQERHQQTAAQLEETSLRSAYFGDAQRFLAVNPDFMDAYKHLLRSRDEELAHVGVADAKQRAAQIAAEERDIVASSLRAGLSPAQRIYGLAKLRGYAPAGGGVNGAATGENGLASAPAAAANGNGAAAASSPSVSDEIARIKAGTGASKSLSQAGGTGGGLTLEALASMPQEEFDAWLAKASRAQVRAVMGD